MKTKFKDRFFVEIIWKFHSRANKFPQSVNKSEWWLRELDSCDSSASNGLGKVIFSFVVLEVLSILEVLVTESANDGLERNMKGWEIKVCIYRWYRSVKAFVKQILKKMWRTKIQSVYFLLLCHLWGNSGGKFEGQRIQSMIRELTWGALPW